MSSNNLPHPIFDTEDDRSYFLVKLPVNPYFDDKNKNKNQDEVQDEDQDEVYFKKLKDLGLNETEFKIIRMLKTSW